MGRVTGGTGNTEELTSAQATTLINTFTDALKGLAPLSGGGTTNFLRADATWAVPPGTGTGDMILAAIQTVTGAKTFADDAFLIQNPAITFAYLFQGGAIVADRTINLPLLIGNDTLVMEDHIQTVTNKTINATNNTILDTGIALGDILKSNGTKYVNFATGTALQHIRVNTGATDIEYADDGFVVLGETTLGAAGDTLSVTFVTRQVLKIYYLIIASGVINMEMSFNGDGASGNYAFQRQQDGGAWADDINSNQIEVEPGSVDEVGTGYLVVLQTSGEERMYKQYFVGSGTTGPGTVPDKQQIDGKWSLLFAHYGLFLNSGKAVIIAAS